ncbi:MAG: BamA/TamA family outer membrane protein [Marinilabiliaceae bacterium]
MTADFIAANDDRGDGADITSTSSRGVFERVSGLGENVIDLITWEWDETVFTVYPVVGMNPRSGFVYGVMPALKWDSPRAGKVNTLTVNAEASTKGMKLLQVEHEWYFQEQWVTRGKTLVGSREDRFWPGRGQDDYSFNRKEERMDWFFLNNLTASLWGGVEVLWGRNRLSDLTFTGDSDIPGQEGGIVSGIGPAFVFDNRQRTLAPAFGNLIELTCLFAGQAGIGDYSYERLTLDARHYRSRKESGTVWAFQSIVDFSGGKVPFYEAPQLGGKERLRGIGHPLRQTGQSVWLVRGELRQPVWWRLGAVFFAGVGKAGDDFSQPFNDVTGSFGTGLRFRILPDDPLNVRFDFGASTMNTTGFYISLKEAF